MFGLSFNELYEKIFYGADIEFTLNGWHYMMYCGWDDVSDNKIHSIEVVKSDQPFYEQVTAPRVWEVIFESKMKDGDKNIESFLQSKLFDGKRFLDVEADILVNYS